MVINRCGVKSRLRDSAALRVLAFACRRSLDPMETPRLLGRSAVLSHANTTVRPWLSS